MIPLPDFANQESTHTDTMQKHQQIRAIFGRSENTFQSFIMVVYEKLFFSFSFQCPVKMLVVATFWL